MSLVVPFTLTAFSVLMGLVLLGIVDIGPLLESLWNLYVIGFWIAVVVGSAVVIRRRVREKTLGRLIRAWAGTLLVAGVLLAASFVIDRMIVDLGSQGLPTFVLAIAFASATTFTFYRLNRTSKTTPNPAQ